jgi:thioredoxin reductase (NADPH)
VAGGGDAALEEAIMLTRSAREVTVVHRRDSLRASKALQRRAFANPKIRFVWDAVIEEVVGECGSPSAVPHVTGLRLRDAVRGQRTVLPADGLFVAIGHRPNATLVAGQLPLDDRSYLVTVDPQGTATAVAGVFAAGDVRDSRYRQAVTAAADGCKAALDAERWLGEAGTDSTDLIVHQTAAPARSLTAVR